MDKLAFFICGLLMFIGIVIYVGIFVFIIKVIYDVITYL
jgi:hypothetical protein